MYRDRFGAWYEEPAAVSSRACRPTAGAADNDALLRVVQTDAGILLASLKPR